MQPSMNDIRRRLQKLYSSYTAGNAVDPDFQSQLIRDMAKLPYNEINRLRSEFQPNWFLPEWYDPQSKDCYKAQRERYYAEAVIKLINKECRADFKLDSRPEKAGGTETHDFDYKDSKKGKIIALEVVRLLEPDQPYAFLHPRPISNLIRFWQRVERKLTGKLVGRYHIIHCPLIQDWRSLECQCAQEILKLAPSIDIGQTSVLHNPDKLRGTILFKEGEEGYTDFGR